MKTIKILECIAKELNQNITFPIKTARVADENSIKLEYSKNKDWLLQEAVRKVNDMFDDMQLQVEYTNHYNSTTTRIVCTSETEKFDIEYSNVFILLHKYYKSSRKKRVDYNKSSIILQKNVLFVQQYNKKLFVDNKYKIVKYFYKEYSEIKDTEKRQKKAIKIYDSALKQHNSIMKLKKEYNVSNYSTIQEFKFTEVFNKLFL